MVSVWSLFHGGKELLRLFLEILPGLVAGGMYRAILSKLICHWIWIRYCCFVRRLWNRQRRKPIWCSMGEWERRWRRNWTKLVQALSLEALRSERFGFSRASLRRVRASLPCMYVLSQRTSAPGRLELVTSVSRVLCDTVSKVLDRSTATKSAVSRLLLIETVRNCSC